MVNGQNWSKYRNCILTNSWQNTFSGRMQFLPKDRNCQWFRQKLAKRQKIVWSNTRNLPRGVSRRPCPLSASPPPSSLPRARTSPPASSVSDEPGETPLPALRVAPTVLPPAFAHFSATRRPQRTRHRAIRTNRARVSFANLIGCTPPTRRRERGRSQQRATTQ